MINDFKFKSLATLTFCLYLFWGSFGIDLTLNHDVHSYERIPLHRGFILLTAFLLLSNYKQVIAICIRHLALMTLIILVGLTAAWSHSPSDTIKQFVFISSTFLISIIIAITYYNNTKSLIIQLFWLFYLMSLASIFTAIYFPHIGMDFSFATPRWIGITSHPNALGMQSMVFIWLSISLYFMVTGFFKKAFLISSIALGFFIILKADSVTSLFASLLGVFYTIYYQKFWNMSSAVKIGIYFIAFISFLAAVTIFMSTSELVDTILSPTGRNSSFTGRAFQWRIALQEANNSLIFGIGFDNLEHLSVKYKINMTQLHNGYIEVFLKGGLVASLLLIYILLKTYFQQTKIRSLEKNEFIFLNTGLVIILIHNITESSLLKGLSVLSIMLTYIIISTDLKNMTRQKKLSPLTIIG